MLALSVKFIFFEDRNDVAKRPRFKKEKVETEEAEAELDNLALDDANTASMNVSLRQRFERGALPSIQQPSVFPFSGVGGDWIEDDNEKERLEYSDKEVQTDAKYCESGGESSSSKTSEVPRSVEECLEIYKSEVRVRSLAVDVNPVLPVAKKKRQQKERQSLYVNSYNEQKLLPEKLPRDV